MLRWLAIVATSLALAACGASRAASPSMPRSAACGPESARTLAASNLARVYVLAKHVYGCSRKNAKSYSLGQLGPCLGVPCVSHVRVAGELAAYASSSHGVDTALTQVVVRRLDTGKVAVRDSATVKPLGPESFQAVDALVLKRDGAVAWIGQAHSIVGHGTDIEVVKHDSDGQKLLDSGSRIKTGSLRLHGSTLTWIDGGATRSAMLR